MLLSKRRRRRRGMNVLKAVSSSLRLRILETILERGPLSYTEIMNILRLNPSRDAGRFAYHLKYLLKVDLLESNAKTRKYHLTSLGRMILDISEDLELSRGAIIHHLNNFIKSGLIVKENNLYRLRSQSLRKSIEEIKIDIDRIFDQIVKISKEIDDKLGHFYR